MFPVRTTLYMDDFLETSIETIKADWTIFANTIRSLVTTTNSALEPICNRIIDCMKKLSENKSNSQEAIVELVSLRKFIDIVHDNSITCNSIFLGISARIKGIMENSDNAIDRFGVARDIRELDERISLLLIPISRITEISEKPIQFWDAVKAILAKMMDFYKTHSNEIDRKILIDNANTDNLQKSPNSTKPISRFSASIYSLLSYMESKSESSDSGFKKKLKLPLTSSKNYDELSYKARSEKKSSRSSYTKFYRGLENGTNTSTNTKNINDEVDQSGVYINKNSNKSNLTIETDRGDRGPSSIEGVFAKTPTSPEGSLRRQSPDGINPVPFENVYWIAKHWHKIISSHNQFVDKCIDLMENYFFR
ncbi:hypothetical protein BB559_001962 [Furculomyces boomerangus]|uniref:Uncharacterized protein n=1 Tax=Furculomyces boomerangus TaxID=61424 RepID=A0A2T9YYY9_9FUNG|nr:hypothetical protein BB559_001962 [Furculomyces boomerangus]